MRAGLTVIVAIFMILLLCFCIYSVIMTSLVNGMVSAMPYGQDVARSWMLGTPVPDSDLNAGEIVGPGVMNVGTVGYTGYSGPTSFVCRPLVDAPFVPLTDTFGTYRLPNYNHSGIDFGTNYSNGHPVITPMGGQVTYTGIYGGWGYTMVIENDGYQVLLTHAQEMLYEVGSIVSAGDTVMLSGGGVGDSRDGSSTGPHLHFETRKCEESSDGNVYCKAYNPDGIILPGQNSDCTWTQQTIIPNK